MQNAVVPLFPMLCTSSTTSPKHYGTAIMTSNTDTDNLSIYMGLKYRSMRHVTLGVAIMVITLSIDTIDGSVTDVFATYS